VSAEIQKNLDYNLLPDEVVKVKHRLSELRLQMPAYHVDAIPPDPELPPEAVRFREKHGRRDDRG
jgi:hypothetical protein